MSTIRAVLYNFFEDLKQERSIDRLIERERDRETEHGRARGIIAATSATPGVRMAAHHPTVNATVACGRSHRSGSRATGSSSSSVSETGSPCASGLKFSPTPRSPLSLKAILELKQFQKGEWRKEPVRLQRRHLFFSCLLSFSLMQGGSSMADQKAEEEFGSGDVEDDPFGFDGLGKSEEDYAAGKVVALAQSGDGAILFISVDGFDLPLRMLVGAAEAMAILAAAQERQSSRPVTHEAWGSSLSAVGWKVARVTITSMENDVFYSRLVLSLEPSSAPSSSPLSGGNFSPPSDGLRSVDMRPADGIALALRCRAPLFISKSVAEDIVGALLRKGDTGKKQPDPLESPGLQAQEDYPSLIHHVSNCLPQNRMSSLIVFSEDDQKRLTIRFSGAQIRHL